jgi:hypothetical protein
MLWILVAGIVASAIVAYLVRGRPRLQAVTGILTSQGFSADTVDAIRSAPGDEEITVTLADGRSFKTTAAEAAKRLQPGPDGKTQTWLEQGSSNLVSIVLFVLGCLVSWFFYYLSLPAGSAPSSPPSASSAPASRP